MDAVLHRIEALPGAGRYAVTFRRPDGGEQTAVLEVVGDDVRAAEASLPPGWTRDGDPYLATVAVVLAFHAARAVGADAPELVDVDGGWDVGLGNVVLDAAGAPACTAHGPLSGAGEDYVCAECGARARLVSRA